MCVKRSAALLCTTSIVAALAATTSGTATAQPGPEERRRDAIAQADRSIAADRGAVAAGRDEAFAVRDVVLDDDGSAHVRYDRAYRGLPVLGGDVVVHHDSAGRLRGVSRTQAAALGVGTRPAVAATRATDIARRSAPGTVAGSATPRLVVHARTAEPRLAYEVLVTGTTPAGDPSELEVVVDALDGRVLDREQEVQPAKPVKPAPGPSPAPTVSTLVGNALYSGRVSLTGSSDGTAYSLKDATRGGAATYDLKGRTSGSGTLVSDADGVLGTGVRTDPQSAAVDAHYGAARTWDYFAGTHGRKGIRGDGAGAASRVHYGKAYSNAFWSDSCFCMTFGDGDGVRYDPLVSLDIVGHEMSHGVTSRTANLTYSGESGGLNEATSDIFGTMVEFAAGNAADPGDYLLGEEVLLGGGGTRGFRSMYDPSLDGSSPSCYRSGLGALDVHHSSGVANRFFFLLAEGSGSPLGNGAPTCDGSRVSGVGRDAAAKVWYRALTVYMTSSTDYARARTATLQAATDLGGGALHSAVDAAWAAVAVR